MASGDAQLPGADLLSGLRRLPHTRVFTPTLAQWADPCAYLKSIHEEGARYGVVLVRPPAGWNPPSRWPAMAAQTSYRTDVTVQNLALLKDGVDFENGRTYTPAQYKQSADKLKRERYPQFPHPVADAAGGESGRKRAKRDGADSSAPPSPAAAPRGDKDYPLRGCNQSILASVPAIEEQYWALLELGQEHDGDDVVVEYAHDQDTRKSGSGFPTRPIPSPFHAAPGREWTPPQAVVAPRFSDPAYYAATGWNLTNLPFLKDSLLRFVPEEVNGVNIPWLYYGQLFATFSWHNEDNWAYSINYMHEGEGKVWYGVPSAGTASFEAYVSGQAAAARARKAGLASPGGGGGSRAASDARMDPLYNITTMVHPCRLAGAGVPVYRAVQCPGDFVVTYPQAYHSGFSLGWTMAEAVNFALTHWLEWGEAAVARYSDTTRTACRAPAFPHEQLVLAMATHLPELGDDMLAPLHKQLAVLLARERGDRAALLARCAPPGAVATSLSSQHAIKGPELIRIGTDNDQRLECLQCKRFCHVSALVCTACPLAHKKVACLRHGDRLCKCPLHKRTLAYYWSPADLDGLLTEVVAEAARRGLPVLSASGTPQTPEREAVSGAETVEGEGEGSGGGGTDTDARSVHAGGSVPSSARSGATGGGVAAPSTASSDNPRAAGVKRPLVVT